MCDGTPCPIFADPDTTQHIYPVTTAGEPPVTTGSQPGSFQVLPTPEECDVRYLQTPDPGGMLAALCDGSVRTIARGISDQTFWSAVTPNKGEMLGNDW